MAKSKSSKSGAAHTGGASKSGRSSAGPVSQGPPSSQLQTPTSSGGTYAIGALLLAGGMAALLYMKCSAGETTAAPPPPTATVTEPTVNLPVFAPPPPPEIEEDAGVDAGEEDAGKPKPTRVGPVAAGGGACSACGKGIPSSALTSAVSSTAGLARGCYQRALRTGGAEGGLTVSVSVGAKGNLCGARITNDTLHNPAISSCVLGKFQSRSYPKPQEGCVVVNVPISFKMKMP